MKPVTTSLPARAACVGLALAVPACSGGDRSSAAVASKNGGGTPAVRIMAGGLDKRIYLPVMLARELGCYKAQGLDVRFSDEPDGVEAETAMISGQVDAVVGLPTISLLEQRKLAKPLIDMRTTAGAKAALGGTYPASCLYLTTGYVEKNPEVVQKLVNVYVETLKWIQSHDGLMPADGPKTVYKVLSAFDATVKGHTVNLSKTYTNDFVDKAK